MAPQNQARIDATSDLLARVIDRLPMPMILGFLLVAMAAYFQLQALKDAVVDLQITVKAGNQNYTSLAGEVGLQKFRVGTLEDDVRILKASMLAMQQVRKEGRP